MKTHPVIDLFPPLTDYQLESMAESIKTHGLINPITLSADGETLLDGRQRLKACEMAGVEPRFERLKEGEDEGAFIWSMNMLRYHRTNETVAAFEEAFAYPEDGTGPEHPWCGAERRQQAREIMRYKGKEFVESGLKNGFFGESLFRQHQKMRKEIAEREERKRKTLELPVSLREALSEGCITFEEACQLAAQRSATEARWAMAEAAAPEAVKKARKRIKA